MKVETISIRAKDELTSIVERVIKSQAEEVILDLPKTSNFGRSLLNFQLLKREADSVGKRVVIDCDSKDVQGMAADVGFEIVGRRSAEKKTTIAKGKTADTPSVHVTRIEGGEPKKKWRNISDIVTSPHVTTLRLRKEPQESQEPQEPEFSEAPEELEEAQEAYQEAAVSDLAEEEGENEFPVIIKGSSRVVAEEELFQDEPEEQKQEKRSRFARIFSKRANVIAEEDVSVVRPSGRPIEEPELVDDYAEARPNMFENVGGRLKKIALIAVGLLALLLAIYGALFVMPRARAELTMKEVAWEFKDVVTAQNIPQTTSTAPVISVQVIPLSKKVDLDVPATGQKDVSQKAKGKITIYNAYSSQPQSLVATTRFTAPDGKVFRLEKGITIPGAKISDGKIAPSSIEAGVIADKPGEEYNIGPVSKFTIPGFSGSPKFEGFYAESKAPMSGGFIGMAKVVTQADIDRAKEKVKSLLSTALKEELGLKAPKDLKTIEGMSDANLSDLVFSHAVGEKADTFKVSGSLVLKAAYFKEGDIRDILQRVMRAEIGYDADIKADSIQYGVARTDFSQNKSTFPIQYEATLTRRVDVEALKTELIGKNKVDTKSVIFAVPGLESAKVSLWPFWVASVPKDSEKLTIIVQ
jgi:hypothetical protein